MRRTKTRSAPAKAERKNPTKPRVRNAPLPTPTIEVDRTPRVMGAPKQYSKVVTAEHTAAIEQLLMQGHSELAIAKYMDETYNIGRTRVRTLSARVLDAWAKADAENRRHERSAQIRRLKKYIRECEGVIGADKRTWVRKPNDSARAKYEELLMKITGTAAPLELNVNVQVSDALMSAISNMDEDTVQGMLDEYYENQQLAARARELLGPSQSAAE